MPVGNLLQVGASDEMEQMDHVVSASVGVLGAAAEVLKETTREVAAGVAANIKCGECGLVGILRIISASPPRERYRAVSDSLLSHRRPCVL